MCDETLTRMSAIARFSLASKSKRDDEESDENDFVQINEVI